MKLQKKCAESHESLWRAHQISGDCKELGRRREYGETAANLGLRDMTIEICKFTYQLQITCLNKLYNSLIISDEL